MHFMSLIEPGTCLSRAIGRSLDPVTTVHTPPVNEQNSGTKLRTAPKEYLRLASSMTQVLTVDLKQLNKNIGPAVEYLRSRLDEPIKVKGSQVKLADTSARATKRLLHKFLRQLRLEGYRILVVHSGLIEVHAPEKEKHRDARATQAEKASAW